MIADRCFDEWSLFVFLKENDAAFTHPLSETLLKNNMSLEAYVKKLATFGTIAYEVTSDNEIEGIVVGYTNDLPEDCGSYITQVVTNQRFRGRGICGRLIKEYIEYCKSKEVRYVWLTTGIKNESAQRAYEKAGFKRVKYDSNKLVKYAYVIKREGEDSGNE